MKTAEERKQEFIAKAKEVHGDKFSYEHVNYINSITPVDIECPIHGIFPQRPGQHIQGQGCQKCYHERDKKILTVESIVAKANTVHNNKFDYSQFTEYKDYHKQKIPIICPEHGLFHQRIGKHLSGQVGCKECLKNINPHSKTEWTNLVGDRLATFYILKCYNDEELFYKIGITSRTIKKRYKSKTLMPYLYEIEKEITGSAEQIWDMEKEYLRKLKGHKYVPKIKFDGYYTECFTSYQ